MRLPQNNNVRYISFIFLSTLWVSIFFILPDFVDNPVGDLRSFLFLLSQFLLQYISTFFLIFLFGLNKYIFGIFFIFFTFLGSIISYYRYAYKITLTPMLIDASLHNDLRTSADVISILLVIYIGICLIIGVFIIRFRLTKISVNHAWILFFLSIVLLLLMININGRIKNSIMIRFPYNVYYTFKEYKNLQFKISEERINPDPYLECIRADSLSVIFVLGESLRSDHLSLNGYNRITTPKLDKRKNIVSYPNIYSEYTNTNRSIPHILTRADSVHIERAFSETSFIPLFKSCGFRTYWIANQESANTYVAFMKECDTLMYAHPEKTVFTYNEWLDEDLLPYVKNVLDKKDNKRNLIILHTIGSHWFYNSHYSKAFEAFKPTAGSRIIKHCTPEEIINSYDNTIVYTDFFLDQLIQLIESENAILIFLSDHGEALGEENAWLHAGEGQTSRNPACFVWYSDKYQEIFPEKIFSLKENRKKGYRTDFLFHSILSAADIPSIVYDDELDIFSIFTSITENQ